jgi:AcrR family transcriptional regulator
VDSRSEVHVARGSKPVILGRKKPRQARSTQLVDDIVEAALRVLMREGGARFTTVRVAAEAGVSVGSLYQYFPNKAALLFRLQADEWEETWGGVEAIFTDTTRPPRERLERAVVAFFRSERQEAALRAALEEAGAPFRETPEAHAIGVRTKKTLGVFVAEAIPDVAPEARTLAADVILMAMGSVAETITTRGYPRAELDVWARASAEMYWSYLAALDAAARLAALDAAPRKRR